MKTLHTPGPWHIGDTNKNFSAKIYAPDNYLVADCADIQKRTEAETKANAKLIEAAPALLQACKMIIDNWASGDLAEAARACNIAFNKATE